MAEEKLPSKIRFKDYQNLFSFGPKGWGFACLFLICAGAALAQLATSFTLANWTSQPLEE